MPTNIYNAYDRTAGLFDASAGGGREHEFARQMGLQWDPGSETYFDSAGRSYFPDQVRNYGGGTLQPRTDVGPQRAPVAGGGGGGGGANGMEHLPQNAFELAAWGALRGQEGNRLTGSNVFGQLAGNQLGGFLNYGNALDAIYNQGGSSVSSGQRGQTLSTSGGPYAQWQDAVTAQAPANAAVKIADIQSKTQLADSANKQALASRLVDSLFGFNAAAPVGGGGMRTNYGAGFTPPRRAAPVDLRRFQPGQPAPPA